MSAMFKQKEVPTPPFRERLLSENFDPIFFASSTDDFKRALNGFLISGRGKKPFPSWI